MQQIADWLEKLGMSEYAQCFAENDINFSILSDLTDQDLKEIGCPRSDIGVSCCAQSPSSKTRRLHMSLLQSFSSAHGPTSQSL